jgi:hypothetical protein
METVRPVVVGAGPVPAAEDGVEVGIVEVEGELIEPHVLVTTHDGGVGEVVVVAFGAVPTVGCDLLADGW